jgi:hypothetical protein
MTVKTTPGPTPGPSNAPCSLEELVVTNASASSIEYSDKDPSKAVDDHMNSRWASLGPHDAGAAGHRRSPFEQWLVLDLERVSFIDTITIKWERAYSRKYEIQVKMNKDDNWEENGKTYHKVNNGKVGKVVLSMLNARGRYVRMYSTEGDTTGSRSTTSKSMATPMVGV